MRRIIITIFGVVLLSPAAHAEHAWGNYHWARTSTTNSIDLTGVNSTTSDWDDSLFTKGLGMQSLSEKQRRFLEIE